MIALGGGRVPPFRVLTDSGHRFDSESFLGRRAFIVVFFASWCEYCASELQSLRRALDQAGPLPIIMVSLDGPSTWDTVPDYLRSFGFSEPFVRAADYPLFALGYDPFETVPLVVIVGKNGELVDYELGYDADHERRLLVALRRAKTSGRLARSNAHEGQAN